VFAFPVCLAAGGHKTRLVPRPRRRPEATATTQQAPAEDVDFAWLRLAKAGSQLKH
jgi:hypothetical protein